MVKEQDKLDWGWIIRLIRNLANERFSGSIRINFHKGNISKKIEKTSYVSEQ